jgi:SAM-dependent methyltransferase
MAEPSAFAAGALEGVAAAGEDDLTNPVRLIFRYVFQERLRALFRPGSRVLELGCGPGTNALLLASCGVSVLGLDASPAMVRHARRRAALAGAGSRVRFEARQPQELRVEDGAFDGACSGFGALDGAALPPVGSALAAVLRAGAPVVLSLTAPHAAVARYRARRKAQRLLGPDFGWSPGFGLGVLLPGPAHGAWAARHPQVFGALAAMEGLVRRWPVLRDLGGYLVLEGARR